VRIRGASLAWLPQYPDPETCLLTPVFSFEGEIRWKGDSVPHFLNVARIAEYKLWNMNKNILAPGTEAIARANFRNPQNHDQRPKSGRVPGTAPAQRKTPTGVPHRKQSTKK
jgi:hypothetical protein